MARRILYVQYADPAAYPPIAHSAEILAERGWKVVLLGTYAFGDPGLRLSDDPRLRVENFRGARTALGQRFQYLRFFLRCLYWVWTWLPDWIYVSDPLALPAVWIISKLTRAKIVYHEHDSPNAIDANSGFMKLVWECRRRVGVEADLCVLPQQVRLLHFVQTTGRQGSTICVWNCPRQREARRVIDLQRGDQLVLYYHGSINSARVPPELVIAACRFGGAVRIRIAGYEVAGAIGYIETLRTLAAEHGDAKVIEYLGAIPLRNELLAHASQADVGLSFMPMDSRDTNLRHMVGASNKPFDCMAQGLPLLVSNLPEWVTTFVQPGFARSCDPTDADSIESELRWYLEHPRERHEMGRRCAEKIYREWNYEASFQSVLSILEGEMKGKRPTKALGTRANVSDQVGGS